MTGIHRLLNAGCLWTGPKQNGTTNSAIGRVQPIAAAILSAALLLNGCSSLKDDYDPNGKVSKKDYESLEGRRGQDKVKPAQEPPIPDFQSVLAAPSAPELADTRRVSIAVTESTPVRDIVIELARKAGVDLELDPRISGGIIMTATDRPFLDVIERICDLADLRYKFAKNTLHVEVDDPYMEQYHLDVLNLTRTSSSDESSSTDAASAAQAIGATSAGGSNKSASSISSKSQEDFWGSISLNIRNIITGIQFHRQIQGQNLQAEFVPEAKPAAPAAGSAAANPAAGGPAAGALNAARGLAARQDQITANLAQDQQGPAAPAAVEARPVSTADVGSSQFTINQEAGIITVFATQRQHKAIERYLKGVLSAVHQEVLIEAKVLQVQLNDQYNAGIDWTAALGPAAEKLNLSTNFTRQVVPPNFTGPTLSGNWSLARGVCTLAGAGRVAVSNISAPPTGATNCTSDLSGIADLVKQFGTVRTLSNPRLTVMNNQMGILKVAQNQVFFQLTATVTPATPTASAQTTVNSVIKTVPVGIILTVQPTVDPISRRITLALRPSITSIVSFVNDPGVALTIAQFNAANPTAAQNVESPVPIILTQEMDSIVNLESGETLVMGGLMQDQSTITREGIPGAMDIPLIGQALGENAKQTAINELVIFIRATLVNARDTIADEDIRLYKTFTPDPRPIAF